MHEQIADKIRRQIRDGVLPGGSVLPSRRDLAAEFGTAVGTVQKALSGLTADGTVLIKGRWGTVVAGGDQEPQGSTKSQDAPVEPQQRERISAVAAGALSLDIAMIGEIYYAENAYLDLRDIWGATAASVVEKAVVEVGGRFDFYNSQCRSNDWAKNAALSINRRIARESRAIAVLNFSGEIVEISASPILKDLKLPVIAIGGKDVRFPFYSVYSDERDAGSQAVLHLIERGAREILFISPYTANWVNERLAGAVDAAAHAGWIGDSFRSSIKTSLDVDPPTNGLTGKRHDQCAYEFARSLLASGARSRAILAANDYVAIGYIHAAAEFGLEVGKDYMIVGFDDSVEAREMGLTTLRPPIEEMGQTAVKIIQLVLNGERPPLRSCLTSHIIERRSTRPPIEA